ncbi:hypothetical protein, conserved [Leishmania donovani]|uniref:Uncharacterized protein n=1 Tax=Leishmania donovani TaxID=5661 RepID=E9B851_LEIDO|nr:hypothetical protein, conserved [Leishmania donovani]
MWATSSLAWWRCCPILYSSFSL